MNFGHRVLRPIDEDYLGPFHRLQNLRIRFGNRSGIKDVLRSLHGLSHRNLSNLDVAHNVWDHIIPQILTDRDLEAIGNICAKRIDLSQNAIVRIQSIAIWNSASRCVQELNLAGNEMIFFDTLLFAYMANFDKIRVLNLNTTLLENIGANIGRTANINNTSVFSDTILSSTRKTIWTFHASETLHTFNCNGQHTLFGDFYLRRNIRYMAKGLKRLYTKQTNISLCEIQDPDSFIIDANITEFDMSGWHCSKLKPTFLADFGGLFQLQKLSARYAQLGKGFSKDNGRKFLKGLKQLKMVDLSKNNLTLLHKDFFTDQHQTLQNLTLDNNRFKSIPLSIHNIQRLKLLSLKGNSFASFSLTERKIVDSWSSILMDFRKNSFLVPIMIWDL